MIRYRKVIGLWSASALTLSVSTVAQQQIPVEPGRRDVGGNTSRQLIPSQVASMTQEFGLSLADIITTAERYCGGRALRADCGYMDGNINTVSRAIVSPPGNAGSDMGTRSSAACVVSLLVNDQLFEAMVNPQSGQVVAKREIPTLNSNLTSLSPGAPAWSAIQSPDFTMPRRLQRSSELIGKAVADKTDNQFGKMEDMIVDVDSGRVLYGIHSFAGTPGLGNRLYPIPWQTGQLSGDNMTLALNLDRAALQSANGVAFPRTQWPNFADEQLASNTFSSFNQTPFWQQQPASGQLPLSGAASTDARANPGDAQLTSFPANRAPSDNRPLPGNGNRTEAESARRGPDGNPSLAPGNVQQPTADTLQRSPRTSNVPTSTERDRWFQPPAQTQRITDLRGKSIRDAQNQEIGKISDVIVDPESGRIVYAILPFRGKQLPIPWNVLSPPGDGKSLVLNVDVERLQNAPGFEREQWPNMVDPQWATDVHSFYNAEPFWQVSRAAIPR